MVIDFHTHLFPRNIRENRQKYFPDEPAFKLLYDTQKSKLAGAKELLASMDEHKVDISVVFGFPWKSSKTFKNHNDYIIETVHKYPDRFKGFCCLDPCHKDAALEVERCLDNGLCGVGEIAFYQSGIDEKSTEQLTPVMNICQQRCVPVMVHTNEPVGHYYPGKTPITLKQIYRFVKKFPENKIVLAHWGGGIFFYNLLKKEVKEVMGQVYYDTAASPFLYTPEIYRLAVRYAGVDKILFGTDFPLLKPARYFKELEQAGLEKKEIEKICGENASDLLDTRLTSQ